MTEIPIFVPDTECDNRYYSIYDKDDRLIGRGNRWYPLRDYLKKRYHICPSGTPFSDDFYVVTEGWKNDEGEDLIWKMNTLDGSMSVMNYGGKDKHIEDFFTVGPTSTAAYDCALKLLMDEVHKMPRNRNEQIIASMKSFVDAYAEKVFGKGFPGINLENHPGWIKEGLDMRIFTDKDYLDEKLNQLGYI